MINSVTAVLLTVSVRYYIPVPVTADQIMSFHAWCSLHIHFITLRIILRIMFITDTVPYKVTTEGCGAYLVLLCLP